MDGTSTLELFARLALSLAVVLGLMWGISQVMRRRGLGPGPRRTARSVQIEVLARRPLGRNTSITVVRAGDRAFVLGVTEHGITKLADAAFEEIDLEDEQAQWTAPAHGALPGPGSAWKTMLDQLRERTVRR
jgi:flagellar protein FliO/FliZ